jgi:hypothetical protein
MSGKCSTGYVVRLLNVLSGFDDFSIQIPIEESLKSMFFHRINQKIKDIEDFEKRDHVLYEMTIPSSYPELRPHFLGFFREIFSQLKEELYKSFEKDMTVTDFDLYLRKVLYDYEGH